MSNLAVIQTNLEIISCMVGLKRNGCDLMNLRKNKAKE